MPEQVVAEDVPEVPEQVPVGSAGASSGALCEALRCCHAVCRTDFLAGSRACLGTWLLVLACSGTYVSTLYLLCRRAAELVCSGGTLKRFTLLKTALSDKDTALVSELAMVPLPGRILAPSCCFFLGLLRRLTNSVTMICNYFDACILV